MLKQLKHILLLEKEYVDEERRQGKFLLRVSRLTLLIVSFFYVVSPLDLFPEKGFESVWVTYLDDIAVIFAGIGLFFADLLTALSASPGVFKKLNIPQIKFYNESTPALQQEEEPEVEYEENVEESYSEPEQQVDEDLEQYKEE